MKLIMSLIITNDSNLSGGGGSSTDGSSTEPVPVVLLEIITVPLLNSGMSVLLEIITVPLLNSVTLGGSSTVVVVRRHNRWRNHSGQRQLGLLVSLAA